MSPGGQNRPSLRTTKSHFPQGDQGERGGDFSTEGCSGGFEVPRSRRRVPTQTGKGGGTWPGSGGWPTPARHAQVNTWSSFCPALKLFKRSQKSFFCLLGEIPRFLHVGNECEVFKNIVGKTVYVCEPHAAAGCPCCSLSCGPSLCAGSFGQAAPSQSQQVHTVSAVVYA